METYSLQKGAFIAPRKARLTLDLIRNKNVLEAKAILLATNSKASRLIKKCLDSAVANATNNLKLDESKLYVKECYINEGRVFKRTKIESRSRVGRSDIRTSHIFVKVAERN